MLRGLLDKIPKSKQQLVNQVQTGENQAALAALRKLQAIGWTQDARYVNLISVKRGSMERDWHVRKWWVWC